MMAQPTEQNGQMPGVRLALSRRNSLSFIDAPVWLDMHFEKPYKNKLADLFCSLTIK
jgi:hypothetical protein